MEPIPLVIQATVDTGNHDLMLVGVTALAGLTGALAGMAGVWIQTFSQKNREIEARLFDARKSAYEKAIAIYTLAYIKRAKEGVKMEAEDVAKEIGYDIHKTMAEFNLFSTKELIDRTRSLFSHFDKPLKVTPQEKKAEGEEMQIKWQMILDSMRNDLGTHGFLLIFENSSKKES